MKTRFSSLAGFLLVLPHTVAVYFASISAGSAGARSVVIGVVCASLPSAIMLTLAASAVRRGWQWALYIWSLVVWLLLCAVGSSAFGEDREFMEFFGLFLWGGLLAALSGFLSLIAYSWGKKEPNQAAQTTPGLRPSVSDL
jgi:hypothetical protein